MSALFPVFLKLHEKKVVVVGAGPVGASKLAGLLEAGARVVVVAPDVVPEVEAAGVEIHRRPFVPSDLDEAWFVVAAAWPEVNAQVAQAAAERRLFVNAVDDPPRASAYLGGIVRRGGLTLALSTDGLAPALAGLLREALEELLPEELTTWLEVAKAEKARWRAEKVPFAERRPLLLAALNRLYTRRQEASS
jgi:siroheme synthase-like protein